MVREESTKKKLFLEVCSQPSIPMEPATVTLVSLLGEDFSSSGGHVTGVPPRLASFAPGCGKMGISYSVLKEEEMEVKNQGKRID